VGHAAQPVDGLLPDDGLFAAVEDTEAFVGKVRALQPAAG